MSKPAPAAAVTHAAPDYEAKAEGIPIWDDTRVLESMEDADTGDIEIPRDYDRTA